MHSNIIQIDQVPISRDEWCEESDFYDSFCGYIADYVDGDLPEDTRKAVIENFQRGLRRSYPNHVEVTEETITFKEGFDDEHDRKMMEAIRRVIDESKDNNECYRLCRWSLRRLINDTYGLYLYGPGLGLLTEETFLSGGLDGRTFYFGAVIDYRI